jgi:hypothetical protein
MATARKTRTAKTGQGNSRASKAAASKTKASKAAVGGESMVVLKPEFVEDLKKVFEKHNWSGHPIGFVANPAVATLGLQPCDPGPVTCPNGEAPQTQWVHCPDGTSILRRFCP